MRLVILILFIVGALASNDDLWHEWKRIYNKEYNGADNEHRRDIWEQNVKHIQEHNLRHDLGLVTYTLGLNQFTDLTFEEFKAKYLIEMSPESKSLSDGISYQAEGKDVPASIDWRQYGYVTEVKAQKRCGSCWAFSTTGAMEGQYMKNLRTNVSFSEQQLIDCTRKYGNQGCGGGYMEHAYEYLKSSGLETESAYPYEARDGECRYESGHGVAKVTGYYAMYTGNEMELQKLVGAEGPAAVAVDVERDFSMYKSGIFQSQTCSSQNMNHAVLTVGYGTENGIEYWIVKNSWGKWWGEGGYIRLARNRNNMCGIASWASVPMVKRFP
ncbi:Secreted cathepsin L 1 [Fasciola gigantica]|uniref:Secreted cathepsin L 1 n=1 Tax=Fasciola gigantica TaxID=46835 RepID=A0A504YT37_FASGI|nr:Secreted cathepsin L 1 [Fasciola gigantica]